MPLKLNIGLSRKIGEANYSSRGASVNVEMELESALVQEPEKFQARIKQLFGMAKTAVDEELRNGHSNGHNGSHGQEAPPATASQARALHAIAKKQHLNLEELLRSRFGVGKPEDLLLKTASELIDELNGRRNGNGGRG